MTRKILRTSILMMLLLACVPLSHAQTNVIFITIDDLNRDSLGIYGCPIPDISPHLDALGHAGLRFEHAHVAAANCTPSRNVMTSGMYPHNNKVLSVSNEGSGNHNTFPTIPDVFNAADYHTGIMGKNSHQQPFHPYAGWDTVYGEYGSTRVPENIYSKLTTAFADAAALGKPLFFNLNIYDPHTGWYEWDHKLGVPEASNEVSPSHVYEASDVPYPTFFPTLSSAEMQFGTGYGIMDEIAAYYNNVKRADDSIGRVMDAIEDAGVSSNTIIIAISDHGVELVGAKTQLYHHSSASPMFVLWPGVTSSNTIDNTHMINSIDFLPSFCEMIGQPIPANIDGKSFLPIIKGEEPANWRGHIYKEHSVGHNMRAVETTNRLYIFNPWSDGTNTPVTVTKNHKSWSAIATAGASGTNTEAAAWVEHFQHRTVEELYDTAVDPDCKINLFTNAAYAAELVTMQDIMEQEMIASGDLETHNAFTNRASSDALKQYIKKSVSMRYTMKNKPEHTRDVFYNPHDDWMPIDHTIFEPANTWGIWEPASTGITLNTKKGDAKSGKNCISFNGSDANISRLVTTNAFDTSNFDQLKLDVIFIDDSAFSSGATLNFQYHDGSAWKTFQTINSAGKKNLIFELPGGGLPDSMLLSVQADFNGSEGRIFMDHARLTAWQDWVDVSTNAPFNASGLGHVRLAFDFATENFSDTDSLILETYDGSVWEPLRSYDFDYVLRTNQTYSDIVDLHSSSQPFPDSMEFRFRSASTDSGQAYTISNYSIETRIASESVSITLPPSANPDSYGAVDPQAIVVAAPGVLENDISESGGNLTATLVGGVTNGILEFNADGSFVYAATNGYAGPDAFTYLAYDGSAFSASTATVSLAIFVPAAMQTNLLSVTFGATVDRSSTYAGIDTKATTTQTGSNAAPAIAITALDIDGIGANDDRIDLVFSVAASGGALSRMVTGYVIDPGYALTFDIESASVTLGNGATNYSISEVGYVSVEGNNGARTYTVTSPDSGFTTLTDVKGIQSLNQDPDVDGLSQFTMTSTDGANNRARNLVAEFQVAGGATLPIITNFSDWAATHNVATNNDYTLDYAFNINPRLSNHYTLPSSGNSGLPDWELSEAEERLTVEFVRRKQALDLTYTAQFTDSLTTNWTDAVSSETITPIDAEFERVSVADDATETTTSNRFGRVIVNREQGDS